MPNALDKIIAAKHEYLEKAKVDAPESSLREQVTEAPPVRDFLAALSGAPPIRLIAEVKKSSPSRGAIRPNCDPASIARIYQWHGAACVSVLTDGPYFQGSLDDLRQVRAAVQLPVLRKDFVIDPYQVLEARQAGADAVLLIADCLEGGQLADLYAAVHELGMTPLVELHDPDQLDRVLELGAKLIGVNNRDLHTLEVDLNHSLRMRHIIPADRIMVGESGIRNRQDVERLETSGVQAMLVGGTLMARRDIGNAVDGLLGKTS
ncbi:MAG: indole-3-glycerol phosphate synthase TrpC [Planctomycetaceae bacterium]|nr:indole-3-glycerol phosphate synthase TrpC [Planctomycetaceae bacterium]